MPTIGIRREDKTEQERRAPLAPQHVQNLVVNHGLRVIVERSPHRIFPEQDYQRAGAEIVDELPEVDLVLGVKEIPVGRLQSGRPHLFFSHTIKAQPYNMPLLQRFLDDKCTLLDYEVVTKDNGRRTIFFGVQAGQAGMVNTLWSLGQRWKALGYDTPFAELKQAIEYDSLDDARDAIRAVGEKVRSEGLPEGLGPVVCGISGYGSVSKGAQEIYNLLNPDLIPAEKLTQFSRENQLDSKKLYLVVFYERDMVTPADPGAQFELQEYYDQPEKYRAAFSQYLPHLTLLVNAIYWEPRYPRLVTWDDLAALLRPGNEPRLTVIGDITCDPQGSIESTIRPTLPENPVYVVDPDTRSETDGFAGKGMQMMTVDILPAEIPKESTVAFGDMLMPYMPKLAAADFSKPYEELVGELPEDFRNAMIAHQGALTPPYEYLRDALKTL